MNAVTTIEKRRVQIFDRIKSLTNELESIKPACTLCDEEAIVYGQAKVLSKAIEDLRNIDAVTLMDRIRTREEELYSSKPCNKTGEFAEFARRYVVEWILDKYHRKTGFDEVHVVWVQRTMRRDKALLYVDGFHTAMSEINGMYIELVHDEIKEQLSMCVYTKREETISGTHTANVNDCMKKSE